MAKTKKVALVENALKRAAPPSSAAAAPADPAPKRMRKKTSPSTSDPPSSASAPGSTEPPECEITWNNFELIQRHYGLSFAETSGVLLSVIGPDTSGSRWWEDYKKRCRREEFVKKLEAAEKEAQKDPPPAAPAASAASAASEAPAAPAASQSVAAFVPEEPDNQLGDPTLYPESFPADVTDDDEGYEEEGGEEDPEMEVDDPNLDGSDQEPVDVFATTHSASDDGDSPQPGVSVDQQETQEMMVDPPEAVEPVVEPCHVDDPAQLAKEQLEKALKAKPTPGRSGRKIVHAERVEEPLVENNRGELKSLLSSNDLLQKNYLLSLLMLPVSPSKDMLDLHPIHPHTFSSI